MGFKSNPSQLLVILALCALIVSTTIVDAEGQTGFRVILSLDKDSFVVAERIYVGIGLENAGTVAERYAPPSRNPLILRDSDGKVYTYYGPNVNFPASSYSIEPGQVIDKEIPDLLWFYGKLPDIKGRFLKGGVRKSLPPGEYTVQAVYYLVDASTGKHKAAKSNVVDFSVHEPMGEERLAYGLLERGLASKFEGNFEDAILNLSAVVEQYPNSAYGPMALDLSSVIHSVQGDRRKALESTRKLIELYPESRLALERLRTIPVYYVNLGITDEQFVRNVLTKLGEEKKGTQIEKAVEEMLQEFDAGTSSFHQLLQMRKKASEK